MQNNRRQNYQRKFNRRSRFWLALILLITVSVEIGYLVLSTTAESTVCGSIESMEPNENNFDQRALQDSVERASAQNDNVGIQATVIWSDGSEWTGAAGLADRKKSCPMSTSHHLYIGSMTKLFTAGLVLDLVHAKGLPLDDPFGESLDYPGGEGISLRNLLDHTSGIPNYTQDAWFAIRYILLAGKHWQPIELSRIIANKPLDFPTGTRHEYSNSNYVLLGRWLENITSKPYPRLLRERLLEALKLGDTYCLDRPEGLLIANAYDRSQLNLGLVNVTGLRTSLESGAYSAGCIVSTSQDVAKYTRALFRGEFLSADGLRQMTTFIAAPDEHVPQQTGYGLGVRRLEIDGQEWYGHTGTIPGYTGAAFYNPHSGDTVVILSNLSGFDVLELLAEFQRILSK